MLKPTANFPSRAPPLLLVLTLPTRSSTLSSSSTESLVATPTHWLPAGCNTSDSCSLSPETSERLLLKRAGGRSRRIPRTRARSTTKVSLSLALTCLNKLFQLTNVPNFFSTGAFGVVRHPNYAYYTLSHVGYALATGSIWNVALTAAAQIAGFAYYSIPEISGHMETKYSTEWKVSLNSSFLSSLLTNQFRYFVSPTSQRCLTP